MMLVIRWLTTLETFFIHTKLYTRYPNSQQIRYKYTRFASAENTRYLLDGYGFREKYPTHVHYVMER